MGRIWMRGIWLRDAVGTWLDVRCSTPLTRGVTRREIARGLAACALLVCACLALVHGLSLAVRATGWHGVL